MLARACHFHKVFLSKNELHNAERYVALYDSTTVQQDFQKPCQTLLNQA